MTSNPDEPRSKHREQHADTEVREVPGELEGAGMDMMEPHGVVADDPLDDDEQPPSEQ